MNKPGKGEAVMEVQRQEAIWGQRNYPLPYFIGTWMATVGDSGER